MSVAELVTIGNEILDGRVTDTNRSYLGRRLKELDYEVRYAQSVDDHMERVGDALRLASSRSDLIVCTGGLGPTSDDLTAEAVAKFLGCSWELNADAEKFLKDLFVKRQRDLNPSQLKQAKLPKLCKMIFNPVGTAPGFFFKGKIGDRKVSLYFFPGVPKEMRAMFEESVAKTEAHSASLKTYTWSTLFTREGDLQEQLKETEKEILPLKLGYRTHIPENHISLLGRAENAKEEKHWQASLEKLQKILSPLSFHEGVEKNYEEIILEKLVAKKARILFVESCTGGLLSHLLTDVSGSSKVLWGSQVCYANEEKIRLGVNLTTIKKHGAVSAECAAEMALAGLDRLIEDELDDEKFLISLSTTGIAGPTGGSERKPVGLMYIALAYLDVSTSKVETTLEKVQAPVFLERKTMKLYMAKRALETLRVNFLTP